MSSKRHDPFTAVARSKSLVSRWLQEFDADAPIPFPRCELVSDSVRVVARPTEAVFDGRFSLDPLATPPEKVIDATKMWPTGREKVLGTMRITPHGAAFVHIVAAAERAIRKAFKLSCYGQFSALDGGGVEIELTRRGGLSHGARFACAEGFSFEGEPIKFTVSLLADLIDGTGDVEIRHHGPTLPALITPTSGDDEWLALQMPCREEAE